MKLNLLLLTLVGSIAIVHAQNPQIAVVRPDGTTFICPTFDSAYNIAQNGDYLYLPGKNLTVTNPISKKLFIYGAGYNSDSSLATGITTLNALTILQGADGGSIEGVLMNVGGNYVPSITFGNGQNSTPFSSYTISKCYISSGVGFYMPSENITIKNNYVGRFAPSIPLSPSIDGIISNSLISNNIIIGSSISSTLANANLEVDNNVFFYSNNQGNSYYSLASNSTYRNNIFQNTSGPSIWESTNSYFYNNANGYTNGTGNITTGTVNENWDLTFESPGSLNPWGFYDYDVHNNYHIKTTSLCHSTGTDGTDRGVYGGSIPWQDGSVPSNPHIYFKLINTQTSPSGTLPVQIKVRTNN